MDMMKSLALAVPTDDVTLLMFSRRLDTLETPRSE
jgi:hypothetical protein